MNATMCFFEKHNCLPDVSGDKDEVGKDTLWAEVTLSPS